MPRLEHDLAISIGELNVPAGKPGSTGHHHIWQKGSTKSRTTIRIKFIMFGRLSVGLYSHCQMIVEPDF